MSESARLGHDPEDEPGCGTEMFDRSGCAIWVAIIVNPLIDMDEAQ